MRLRVVNLILLLFISYSVAGQILPEPGAKLNFTQVMFDYTNVKGATRYIVQIIEDTTGSTFEHPSIEQSDVSTATLVNYLKFGEKYLWRYAGIVNGTKPDWHGPYNFEILSKDKTDADFLPATVLINDTGKNANGLIVADFGYVINRNGNPVWYLPSINNKFNAVRDLRITPFGTITFLSSSSQIYEIDLQGHILWQGPVNDKISGDTLEIYHHDFQRLSNGHYMALITKSVWKKVPPAYQQEVRTACAARPLGTTDTAHNQQPSIGIEGDEIFAKIKFGIIIEYDQKGNILWSWDSERYFSDADIFPPFINMLPNAGNPVTTLSNDPDTHLNAFAVDEKNEFVYAGFRQISRVVKIEKKTGKVVYSWGDKMQSGEAREGNGFFCHQHGLNILRDGSIAVFDNSELRMQDKPARAVIFTQPSDSGPSKILWQFDCIFDSIIAKSGRGGNVDELPDGNILVCMGTGPLGMPPVLGKVPLEAGHTGTLPPVRVPTAVPAKDRPKGVLPLMSRIFEVTRNKQIVWSAVIKNPQKPPYRAHYTSSLYPCYFTSGSDKEGIYGSTDFFTLTIYNKGSEMDSYTISTRFINAGITAALDCNDIPAGKLKNIRISPDRYPSVNDEIEVVIRSKTNPDFERKFKLFFRK